MEWLTNPTIPIQITFGQTTIPPIYLIMENMAFYIIPAVSMQ
jgi:hypothetical protein